MVSNHRKFLLFLIALVGFIAAEWTKEMEHYRKANCGVKQLPTSDEDEGPVDLTEEDPLVQVTTKDAHGEFAKAPGAGGIYVSPRHIITSAQAVFDENKKWLFDEEKFDVNMCDANEHLVVPDRYLSQIVVRSGHCVTGGCAYVHKPVDKAIILFMCSPNKNKFHEFFATMVLEFSQDMAKNFVCLGDGPTIARPGVEVHTYGFQYKDTDFQDSEMIHRKIEITEYVDKNYEKYILFPKMYALGDRGGPMLFFNYTRWWVIGVGATTGLDDRASDTFYYDVRKYQDQICSFFALCGREAYFDPIPTPFQITIAVTDAPTTTEAPITTTEQQDDQTTEPVTLARPAPRAPIVAQPTVKPDPPPKATVPPPEPTPTLLQPTPKPKPQENTDVPVFTANPNVDNVDKSPVVQPYISGVVSRTLWSSVVLVSIFLYFTS
uniref:Peptidase S1 domain-containing protein n=1 Tax=Caenorhabditis japonica TaxID=281687 RepID=A0A8R1HI58_CAEJA